MDNYKSKAAYLSAIALISFTAMYTCTSNFSYYLHTNKNLRHGLSCEQIEQKITDQSTLSRPMQLFYKPGLELACYE